MWLIRPADMPYVRTLTSPSHPARASPLRQRCDAGLRWSASYGGRPSGVAHLRCGVTNSGLSSIGTVARQAFSELRV